MTVPRRRPPYDPANPPAGVRLELGVLAAALKISAHDMAQASGIPRTTLQRLLTNEWPVRSNAHDHARVRAALAALFTERGATPEQLAVMWHAHGHAALPFLVDAEVAARNAASAVRRQPSRRQAQAQPPSACWFRRRPCQ